MHDFQRQHNPIVVNRCNAAIVFHFEQRACVVEVVSCREIALCKLLDSHYLLLLLLRCYNKLRQDGIVTCSSLAICGISSPMTNRGNSSGPSLKTSNDLPAAGASL